jgi:hypothetical protein
MHAEFASWGSRKGQRNAIACKVYVADARLASSMHSCATIFDAYEDAWLAPRMEQMEFTLRPQAPGRLQGTGRVGNWPKLAPD